jgi:predicted phage terminase large subunit-like protein
MREGVCIFCAQKKSTDITQLHIKNKLANPEKAEEIRAETQTKARDQVRRVAQRQAVAKEKKRLDKKAAVTAPDNKKELAKQELARRELSKRRLLPFVLRFFPEYQAGWVHKDICERLEKFSDAVTDKKSPRLMLFMPPRHGKSLLASTYFPAWHIGRNPTHEFIACSYSGSLAMSFSRKVRQVLREKPYQTVFKETRLDKDSQSAEAWLTEKGGGYVAAGVGGAITGKGAHVLVIDDPVKNREDAESETGRQSVKDWYTSTAYTRLAPGGGVLVILTRWHDDDLAGWLLEQQESGDKWEVIKYPAIAEIDEPHRKKGTPLHDARYDLESLRRIRAAVGPRDWSALYQQNPVADEGEYFTRSMIRYYDTEPPRKEMKIYAAWDLAIGQREANDYTVGVVMGVSTEDKLYLLHVERGRWNGHDIVEKLLDVYEAYRPDIIGIEKGQIEMAIGPFLEKRIRERNLFEAYFKDLRPGKRDKMVRARAIQGRMQQGMVLFPKNAEFTVPLINEMLRFPNGVHDDQVDAMAWIGLMMAEFNIYRAPVEKPPPSWRDKLVAFGKGKKNAMTA